MRVAPPPNPTNNRKFDTFSRNHREQLALGPAAKGDRKGQKSKARITVTVRKRPLTVQESGKGETDIIAVPSRKVIKVEEPRTKVTGQAYTEVHEFRFDRVYSEKCTNQEVYESCVKTLVDAIFESGCRCSCFAFGQTGSGKTYTMVGPKKFGRVPKEVPPEHRGLWDWAAQDLIEWVKKPAWRNYGLYCSFYEIYCNKVYDLLDSRKHVRALESKTADGVVVKDLTITRVEDEMSMISLMDKGLQARITGRNSRNNDSSRGHAIFSIELKHVEQQSNHGKLAFIDLAGSERGADSMQSGRTTQQDGAGINRSLLALKECIRALDSGSSHVPFRESELTKVLREMFITETALTLMIANVSPTDSCCEQTLNTLRYADRVWQMRKHAEPCINEPFAEGEEEMVSVENGGLAADDMAEYSVAELSDPELAESRLRMTSDIHQMPGEAPEEMVSGASASESDYTELRPAMETASERKTSDYRTQTAGGKGTAARGYAGNRITAAASRAGALNLVGSARGGEEMGRQDSNDERSVTTRKYQPSRVIPTAGGAVLSRSSIARPTSPRGQPPTSRATRYEDAGGGDGGLSLPVSGRGGGSGAAAVATTKDHSTKDSSGNKKASSRVLKAAATASSDYRKLKTSNAFVQPQQRVDPPAPPTLRSSRPPHERRSRMPTHRHQQEMSRSPPGSNPPANPPSSSEIQSSGSSSQQHRILAHHHHIPHGAAEEDPSSDSGSNGSSLLSSERTDLTGCQESSCDNNNGRASKWRSESPVQSSFLTRPHATHKLAASAIPQHNNNESSSVELPKQHHRSHRRVAKEAEETPPGPPDYSHLMNTSYVRDPNNRSDTLDKSSDAIPSDLLERVRMVMPAPELGAPMNLSECPEDELKRRQVSSAASGWKTFVDFIMEQQEALNTICTLTLYHVELSREMDAMIGPRKPGGSSSGASSGKAVNVAPEKLRDARAVLEQQVAASVRLGRALAKAESALAVCEQYERELQKRSMQSLQFYQSIEPSRRETRKKALPHRALENATAKP